MIDLEAELRDALADAAGAVPISANPMADHQRRTASAPRSRFSARLAMAGIVGATAVIIVGAILVTSGGGHHNVAPAKTGDSKTVILTPATHLSQGQLPVAAAILFKRLTADGVQNVHIATNDATGSLTATVPRTAVPLLTASAQAIGVLRFRQVLEFLPGSTNHQEGVALPKHPNRGPAQAVTLTPAFTRSFANWNCNKDADPTSGRDIAADYIIACDSGRHPLEKYLLAPVAVDRSQIARTSGATQNQTGQWLIDLTFTASGGSAWQKVTETADAINGGKPESTPGACQPPRGCNGVAIALDGRVVIAPYISQPGGITTGQAQISSNFTRIQARRLAAILQQQPLPTTFTAMMVG